MFFQREEVSENVEEQVKRELANLSKQVFNEIFNVYDKMIIFNYVTYIRTHLITLQICYPVHCLKQLTNKLKCLLKKYLATQMPFAPY